MKHFPFHGSRFFFTTPPLPCPYLDDKVERRVVTELMGRDAPALHEALSAAGFRRSHGLAYAPSCPECQACKAVRVLCLPFVMKGSFRRVWKLNEGLGVEITPARATPEQFRLFTAYQESRHGDGDMARMDYGDYRSLVEETPVDSFLTEFRDGDGVLVAACLSDRMKKGLSAVYSFFDPAMSRKSLGTFMILYLIEQAKTLSLPYVYLGFWVEASRKMSYKSRFGPMEAFTPDGWRPLIAPKEEK